MILSGYLGSADNAAVVADFVARAKAKNPALLYCCDPVLGDRDRGLFVHADIPPLVRDLLCPLADIITPNHFEFEWLSGAKAATIDQVLKAARAFMARGTVVVTSAELADTPEGEIETLAVERANAWRVRTPKLPISPNGTGDLFAALLVAARLRGADTPEALSHAASAIFAVLERTAASATRKCASSRARSSWFTRSANSNVSPSARRPDGSDSAIRRSLQHRPRISLRSIRATTPQERKMSRFWSSLTHDLKPYVPGEQPRMAELVKLNTNESPFGPSPRALEAIRGEAADTLRLYPDPQATALRAALATYHQVRPEQVFVGNGSDEVLAHAFAALLKHDAPLLFPDITYSFYPVYCRLFGIAYEAVPLDQAMQIRVADYRRPAGALIIPNPNAPTGVALSRAEIVTLLEQHPDAPVVIDEAYVDFGAETAIPLVASHPNLLVVQTMSKSRALAGLRVGYAIGDADLIEALTRVKDSFNSYPLGRPAQAGAIASLEDEAYFQQSRARVIEGRERLNRGLARLGFDVLPSCANFVFARHPAHEGAALATALRQRAVIVRHFSAPRISDYLRISVGTDEQIDRLLSALSDIMGSP